MILNQPQSEGAFGQASARFALLRGEIARRGALAFQPRPADVRGPKWQALLGELRTPVEHWQASRQARISDEPQLDSRPVMLLPGFGTHPVRMKPLARALEAAGHRVSDWGLGFNFGPTEDRFERLCERVVTMARKEGEPLKPPPGSVSSAWKALTTFSIKSSDPIRVERSHA